MATALVEAGKKSGSVKLWMERGFLLYIVVCLHPSDVKLFNVLKPVLPCQAHVWFVRSSGECFSTDGPVGPFFV